MFAEQKNQFSDCNSIQVATNIGKHSFKGRHTSCFGPDDLQNTFIYTLGWSKTFCQYILQLRYSI